MFCTNCGNQIPDDSSFCTFCGTPVGAGVPATPAAPSTAPTTAGGFAASAGKFFGNAVNKVESTVSTPGANAQVLDHSGVPGPDGVVYSIAGVRGRHIKIYEDKVVITTKVSVGSLITGNVTDGEKTIYYMDCNGVQYKKSGLTIGYLQLETASGVMNNKQSNMFNENTFTFDTTKVSNEDMEQVANYVKRKIDEVKSASRNPVVAAAPVSAADEILKLKELLDMGILTQEEFDAKKKQLLGI